MADGKEREVFIEIVTVGDYAKVSAIDAASGTEVSVTAPATADAASLRAVALRKLEYVMKQKRAG